MSDLQRKNIFRLATAQALGGGNSVIVYATGAVVGDALTPDNHWRRFQSQSL